MWVERVQVWGARALLAEVEQAPCCSALLVLILIPAGLKWAWALSAVVREEP